MGETVIKRPRSLNPLRAEQRLLRRAMQWLLTLSMSVATDATEAFASIAEYFHETQQMMEQVNCTV